MDWIQGITLAIAMGGLALGVFNTVSTYWRGTERVDVKPIFAIGAPKITGYKGMLFVSVEVINAGHIAVTIKEIGIARKRRAKERKAMVSDVLHRVELPHRLDAGAAISMAATWYDIPPMQDCFFGYAITERGNTVWSKRPLRPKDRHEAEVALWKQFRG